MFEMKNLRKAKVPAFALLLLGICLSMGIISILLTELCAYLTCYGFVLNRGKGTTGIWINYGFWILTLLT